MTSLVRRAFSAVAVLATAAGTVVAGSTSAGAGTVAAAGTSTRPGTVAAGSTNARPGTVAAAGTSTRPGTVAAGGTSAGVGSTSADVGLPAGRTVRIMPLGDSITYGVGSSTLDGYRTDLARRLTGAGLDVDFVGSMASGRGADRDNEGHKGWTIAQITENVDGWLANDRPDVILLHIGTNDMVGGNPHAGDDLEELLDRIAVDAPEAEVFVAQLVGLGQVANTSGQRARSTAYNRRVESAVATRGGRFHLVDQRDVHGIDMADRVHPNDFGYLRMAWTWYRALERVLNDTGTDWPHDANPNQAGLSTRCVSADFTLPPYAKGCRVWYHRRPAGAVTSRVWQLPVRHVVRYRSGNKIKTRTTITWLTAP